MFGEIYPIFLIRSGAGFFSGVVFCARKTLARSAFHGFQIGSKRCKVCKSCRARQELSNESLFLNLLFEQDSYSNEYLLFTSI